MTIGRQRRRFVRQLAEQAALLDRAQDAILVLNLDGGISYANPRARSAKLRAASRTHAPAHKAEARSLAVPEITQEEWSR